MADFEWQTEDEDAWESVPAPERRVSKGRRRWPLILILGAFAFGAIAYVYTLAGRQLQRVEAEVRAEILALDELVHTAAAGGDAELFRTALSGRDAAWTDTQVVLAERELALSHAPRPFGLQARAAERRVVGFALNNELTEAIVEVEQAYDVASGELAPAPAVLRQTLIYRRGERRWLLAPPLDKEQFWGAWKAVEGRYISVRYPARDEAVAQRLAHDLDAELRHFCEQSAESCPADWHVFLRLERNPVSLARLADQRFLVELDRDVNLPAPSLVGTPVDEASYRALYRGYAGYVIGLTLTRLAGYECCARAPFYSALLTQYLAQLGLAPRVLPHETFLALLPTPLNLNSLQQLWINGDELPLGTGEAQVVNAFLDFLWTGDDVAAEHSTSNFLTVAAHLNTAPSLWLWLQTFTPYSASHQEQLLRDWYSFVYAGAQRALEESFGPPPRGPHQDVVLVCQAADKTATLHRLNLESGSITDIFERPGSRLIAGAFPDDSGFLLTEYMFEDGSGRTTWWQHNSEVGLLSDSNDLPFLFLSGEPTSSPDGTELVMRRNGPNAAFFRMALLDWRACTLGDCVYENLPGSPAWAPGNTRMLAATESGTMATGLWQSDPERSTSWQQIGIGQHPFWIDPTTYGFIVSSGSEASVGVRLARQGEATERTLLAEELAELLPGGQKAASLEIDRAYRHPESPDTLLILAHRRSMAKSYVFTVQLAQQDGDWLQDPLETEILFSILRYRSGWGYADGLRFSPDGRWLAAMFYGTSPLFVLYDLREEKMQLQISLPESSLMQAYDWSKDGEWLVHLAGEYVQVVHLAADLPHPQLHYHGLTGCETVFWTDRS